MTPLDEAFATPRAPSFEVDWPALDARFDWVRRLKDTPQDAIHHAEGNVWIHTRMVCEALAALPAYRASSERDRRVAFASALLHDVAKPFCTRHEEDGRITTKGHSTKGAVEARKLLWRLGAPFEEREEIAANVRHHQAPFWLLERQDPLRVVAQITHTTRASSLALVAEADARGRICSDQERILLNIDLFREYCHEHGCFDRPFAFPSDHARFLWSNGRLKDPTHAPHEAFRCEVVLMCGFPGSGKDHYVAEHFAGWPVVSLDRLRAEHDVHPDDDQGAIVQKAREEAREHLRAGRSFVWNATNISKQIRAKCIRLFADYDARVRIVYVEVPEAVLHAQNRSRKAVVPDRVLSDMLDRWEVPDRTEAHEVTYAVRTE